MLAALTALTAVGCSNLVEGTPVAAPSKVYEGPERMITELNPVEVLRQGTYVNIGEGKSENTCQLSWFFTREGEPRTKRYTLTAGHCSLYPGDPVRVKNASGELVEVGRVEKNLLDNFDIDAALIELNGAMPVVDVPNVSVVRFSEAGPLEQLPEGSTVCWTLNSLWHFDCGPVGKTLDTGFTVASYTNAPEKWNGLVSGTPVMKPMATTVTPVGFIANQAEDGSFVVVDLDEVLTSIDGLKLALNKKGS